VTLADLCSSDQLAKPVTERWSLSDNDIHELRRLLAVRRGIEALAKEMAGETASPDHRFIGPSSKEFARRLRALLWEKGEGT
jgi:hypothetical protein